MNDEKQDSEAEVLALSLLLLAQGAMGKVLGLRKEDLRAGLDVAKKQLMRGASREALRTYGFLVMCDPGDPDFQFGLANCALHVGEFYIALQAASAMIALHPEHARAYYVSGRALLAIGREDEAVEDLRKAKEFGKQQKDSTIYAQAERWLKNIEMRHEAHEAPPIEGPEKGKREAGA